jgi:single-strand DNA-binding protein
MLNQAQIIGHLGRDPELRYLPSGEAVANFTIATTEKWRDKNSGESKESTEWHNITCFGGLADIVSNYLHKGSLVYVSGKIKTRKYQDKDGNEKYSTSIQCQELKMLGGKPSNGEQKSEPKPQNAPASKNSGFSDMDDDIPF